MAKGGRAVYGEAIGILVLDTSFPRIPGDVANATTFDFPVRYHVIDAATPEKIVSEADRARALLPAFIEGARLLEKQGVRAITTTCGFLTVMQKEIAAAVSVPVVTSSLFLIPLLRSMLDSERSIGVLTAHSGKLSPEHLIAAGVQPNWAVHVRGLEESPAFSRAIFGKGDDCIEMNVDQVEAEVVSECRKLVDDVPGIGCIVFECTNLQPYAPAVQARIGLPIFGIYHLVNLLQSGIVCPRFSGYM
ncbi:aspartate/glutamate racemase family protein [Microvirga makkahensis]|uniref:Aspartate/glutamate racemase family protein n=1 Tax=Microvirga makkahensis TaxID=1128670 RepID=A0A7X3MWW8_9HYPH|nr:aspartate/glutamate racemase family protein [Microvirga makkahensis]MXQ14533.1 aspartate/glutamate racemase family protein [Microvirga makkahensis]